jgi:hypothetical protein
LPSSKYPETNLSTIAALTFSGFGDRKTNLEILSRSAVIPARVHRYREIENDSSQNIQTNFWGKATNVSIPIDVSNAPHSVVATQISLSQDPRAWCQRPRHVTAL